MEPGRVGLDCQDETRDGFPNPIGEAALPDGRAVEGSYGRCGDLGGSGIFAESGNGEGGVEILADVGNYPIRDGPGVDPGDVAGEIAALDEDGGANGVDGDGSEVEGIGRRRCSAGEDAHQKLVGRRTMEPPLEVRVQKLLDQSHVA